MLQILRQLQASFQKPNSRAYNQRNRGATSDPHPISWVIPGKLAVGGLPRQSHVVRLNEEGIRAVLSLCGEQEGALPETLQQNFAHRRLVLPDSHYDHEMDVHQLAAAVEHVQQSIQDQLPIYVHCLAGVERSPTVCIAYLCRYYNLELWEAMNWLKQVHARSMPTRSQTRVLREFIEQYCRS